MLSWVTIILGIGLRLTDLTFPDLDTDEAQAALAATAAWTPAGMMTFKFAQAFFGHEIIVVRSISALFGIALLPLLYLLARKYTDKKTSLLITAVGGLFPSHILFSRLAYLSTQLLFAWTLTLYCFLKARETNEKKLAPRSSPQASEVGWLLALFFASVYATMIKTQGLMLPLILALGSLVEQWRGLRQFSIFQPSPRLPTALSGLPPSPRLRWTSRGTSRPAGNFQFSIFYVLLLSLIPVGTYILTHPSIAATLFLYGGDLYGTSHFLTRIFDLLRTWWHVLSVFSLAILVSLRFLPTFQWPFWIALGLVSMHGLLLGPGNPYYTSDLVLFALPIGLGLSRLTPLLRNLTLCLLLGTTLTLLGPRVIFLNPWTLEPFQGQPYWNTHAAIISEHLRGEEAITVLGYGGHQLRWYLEPQVLVGRNMIFPYPTKYVLTLQDPARARELGEVVYEDQQVSLVRQGEQKKE